MRPPHEAFGNGDYQGGVEYVVPVFVVSPGPEQIPKGKEDDVPALPGGEQIDDDIGELFLGYYVQRDPEKADPFDGDRPFFSGFSPGTGPV
jgi:hypothetical protein